MPERAQTCSDSVICNFSTKHRPGSTLLTVYEEYAS